MLGEEIILCCDLIRYGIAALILQLTACSTVSHEYGPAELQKWDQQKLSQRFVIGAARLVDVEDQFGKCQRKRYTGETPQQGHADLAAGRNLSCSYRYLAGRMPDCQGSACAVSTGMDEYREISAVFTFDGDGWLKDIQHQRLDRKLN